MIKSTTLIVLTAAGLVVSASATDFDFSGNLTKDNDILQFNLTVGAPSTVTVFSSSWDDGGFDPVLSVWDGPTGAKLAEQDDGHVIGSTLSNGVSYDHGDWDSYYSIALPAGSFIATVGEYNNFANGANLSDGFVWDGDPHFTFTQGFGPEPDFNGVLGPNDARTSAFVFHILNVDTASCPGCTVPDSSSTLILASIAIAGVLGGRRWLQRS